MAPISKMRSRPRFCHLTVALVFLVGGAGADAAASGRICTSGDTLIFGNRAVNSNTTANATVTNCGDACGTTAPIPIIGIRAISKSKRR